VFLKVGEMNPDGFAGIDTLLMCDTQGIRIIDLAIRVVQKGWLQQDSINRHLPSSSFIMVSTSHHDPARENKA
jgi:hypothetical protein